MSNQAWADQIPWPVQSGKAEDVTESRIKAFFTYATPSELLGKEEWYRLMSQESKKWHTDKVMSQFGRTVLEGPYGDALNTMAKTIVEMWKAASRSRRG